MWSTSEAPSSSGEVIRNMAYFDPIVIVADATDDGRMLREVLRRRLSLSRRLLVKLKQTECGIIVNGHRARTSDKIAAGDRIELRFKREQSEDILPEPMALDIVLEDDHLLVVNKPAGLIVHPTTGHYTGTLANGIVHYWRERGEVCRFHPVHRLDADTSGLVVIAKHAYAHQQLSVQMAQGLLEKHYRAYVYGTPPQINGEIDAPISRDPSDPHRRIVRQGGAPSLTRYRTAERFGASATALDIELVTGRTHQIRVHMLHIGCPLIGDEYYASAVRTPAALARHLAATGIMARQALHAIRLSMRHPITGEPLTLSADLPDDIKQLEGALRTWTTTAHQAQTVQTQANR